VVWQGFPFVAVAVLAGLKTIPAELHESARVDGGGPWRIFWRITYPLLKPIFLVLLLLSIIWDFGVFTQAYLVTGELGNRDEYNLGIYAYDRAFTMPPSYGWVRAGPHPHGHPADHHHRLRPGLRPAGSDPNETQIPPRSAGPG
jgi:ABC-type sugar transport systems, permease components